MTAYTWKVDITECYFTRSGFENVIKSLYATCTATNGTTSVQETKAVLVGEPDPATFIPFENVTQEVALNWAFELIGDEKQEIQDRLENLIYRLENPETRFIPLQ